MRLVTAFLYLWAATWLAQAARSRKGRSSQPLYWMGTWVASVGFVLFVVAAVSRPAAWRDGWNLTFNLMHWLNASFGILGGWYGRR